MTDAGSTPSIPFDDGAAATIALATLSSRRGPVRSLAVRAASIKALGRGDSRVVGHKTEETAVVVSDSGRSPQMAEGGHARSLLRSTGLHFVVKRSANVSPFLPLSRVRTLAITGRTFAHYAGVGNTTTTARRLNGDR